MANMLKKAGPGLSPEAGQLAGVPGSSNSTGGSSSQSGYEYNQNVAKFNKFVAENKDLLSKGQNKPSVSEFVIPGVGAVAGGALGYWLSSKLHRKPSGLLRAVYALAGGAAGYFGTDALLDIPWSSGNSARKAMRASSAVDNLPEDKRKEFLALQDKVRNNPGIGYWEGMRPQTTGQWIIPGSIGGLTLLGTRGKNIIENLRNYKPVVAKPTQVLKIPAGAKRISGTVQYPPAVVARNVPGYRKAWTATRNGIGRSAAAVKGVISPKGLGTTAALTLLSFIPQAIWNSSHNSTTNSWI